MAYAVLLHVRCIGIFRPRNEIVGTVRLGRVNFYIFAATDAETACSVSLVRFFFWHGAYRYFDIVALSHDHADIVHDLIEQRGVLIFIDRQAHLLVVDLREFVQIHRSDDQRTFIGIALGMQVLAIVQAGILQGIDPV